MLSGVKTFLRILAEILRKNLSGGAPGGGGSVGNGFVIKTTMSFLASPRCSRNNVC